MHSISSLRALSQQAHCQPEPRTVFFLVRLKRKWSSLAHSAAPGCAALALPMVPVVSPAASFSGSALCAWFTWASLCTGMMCWAMQSCSVPLFGCSRGICACDVLQQKKRQGCPCSELASPCAWGSVFPQPRLSRKGTQLSH